MAETDRDTRTPGRLVRAKRRSVEVLRKIPGPLAIFVDIVGLSSVGLWIYRLFDGPAVQVVTASFVCLVALGGIAFAIFMQYRFVELQARVGRSRRLAQSQEALVEVFRNLSRAAWFTTRSSSARAEVQREGDAAMVHLAAVFSSITGSTCRVSVKQVYVPTAAAAAGGGAAQPVDMAVRDLFRSHYPHHDRPQDHIDWVRDNTHFEEILAQDSSFWMADDLLEEFKGGYINSHITRAQFLAKDIPYHSVLVLRITGPGGGADTGVAGFLCIDSMAVGIFRRQFDVSTALATCHALYSLLSWMREHAPEHQGVGGSGVT